MSSGFDPVPSDRLEVTKEAGAALTDFDYRVAASLLKITHSLQWPKDTLSYLTERIALEGFQIPVSQLSGFTQFNALAAPTIATSETTTSTAYTDLATVGPTKTGIPDGEYLIFSGCLCASNNVDGSSLMSIQVNTTGAADADGCGLNGAYAVSIMRVVPKTLSNGGNNTVTAKYRVGAFQSYFQNRWLFALKYAEL